MIVRAVDPDRRLDAAATLAGALAAHAAEHPGKTAITYLVDGEQETVSLSFGELYQRACAVARQINERRPGAGRAIVLQAPGLDYVVSLCACFIAGIAAIPTPLPTARVERTSAQRFQRLVQDAAPEIVLTHSTHLLRLGRAMALEGGPNERVCISTDACEIREGPPPVAEITSATLALVQYTSGSTGDPKGVLIDHGNLAANLAAIAGKFELTRSSVIVNWLPPFHDMGLVGGILEAIWTGYHVVLMDPKHFVARPLRWLQAIDHFKADVSGGANFAYDLCVNALLRADGPAFDLSRWRLAYSGAEPVRAASIDRFADAFAPFGFRRGAFYPCYGLAEATLMATGPDPGAARPVAVPFRISGLEQGRAILADDGAGNQDDLRMLVSCGTPCVDTAVEIVEPATGDPLEDGIIGEIRISGPGVFRGYHGGNSDAAEIDLAPTAEPGQTPFLTGDLGFWHEGGLFVTGRIKDMMIFNGRNHFPNDIEDAAATSHPAVSPHGAAAFSLDTGRDEVLVVACEIRREYRRDTDWTEVFVAIRRKVTEQSGVAPSDIVLLMPGALLRTTSGKVRRTACRNAYSNNDWAVIAREADKAASLVGYTTSYGPTFLLADRDEKMARLSEYLNWRVVELTSTPEAFVTGGTELALLGLDSLKHVELGLLIEQDLGVSLPADWAERRLTLEALEGLICSLAPVGGGLEPSGADIGTGEAMKGPFAVTPMQRAFLEDETKDADGFLEIMYFRTPKGLDAAALEAAVSALNDLHDGFSLRFEKSDDEWTCRYEMPPAGSGFRRIDVRSGEGLDVSSLRDGIIAELRSSISITDGPLVSARLLDRGPGEQGLMIVAFHHLVVDALSLSIWATQLQEMYARAKANLVLFQKPSKALFGPWLAALERHGKSENVCDELDYWKQVCGPATDAIADLSGGNGDVHRMLPGGRPTAVQNRILLERFPSPMERQALFLAAFSRAVMDFRDTSSPLVLVESNGRHPFVGADPQRAVGWFVSQFPVRITTHPENGPLADYEAAKQSLLTVPNAGIGYGLLHSRPKSDPARIEMEGLQRPGIYFQYRGNIDDTFRKNATLPVIGVHNVLDPSQGAQRRSGVSQSICLIAVVSKGTLSWSIAYEGADLEGQARELNDGVGRFLAEIAETGHH
ncbi:MAG: AMP-binding protein [Rhodospirillales bacterium]